MEVYALKAEYKAMTNNYNPLFAEAAAEKSRQDAADGNTD
jgi:hypothetical protein